MQPKAGSRETLTQNLRLRQAGNHGAVVTLVGRRN